MSIDPKSGMTPEEKGVMDHVALAYTGIHGLGLNANEAELAAATHGLQIYVMQRVLNRCFPEYWSSWYGDQEEGKGISVEEDRLHWKARYESLADAVASYVKYDVRRDLFKRANHLFEQTQAGTDGQTRDE